MFTDERCRAEMLAIARAAVTAAVAGRPAGRAVLGNPPPATGVFVTLKRQRTLRGCIGTLTCRLSLAEEVARVAVSAAREDPRFSPVTTMELTDLRFEVSVLGPLERIDPLDENAIAIGRHGLVVEQGWRRGLLLPQVAPEWGWNRDEFLAHTCRKAGLAPDAWRGGADVYRFEADVFGDE
jgi:AmmeMemoRadiSam system protein A